MLDNMDKDINFNISSIGRATHTLTTHGSITKTYTHLTSLKNSILPTLPWLDKQKYKRPSALANQSSFSPTFQLYDNLKRSLCCFYLYLLKSICQTLPRQSTSLLAPHPPNSPIPIPAALHSLLLLLLHS